MLITPVATLLYISIALAMKLSHREFKLVAHILFSTRHFKEKTWLCKVAVSRARHGCAQLAGRQARVNRCIKWNRLDLALKITVPEKVL